jgi:phage-related protein
LGNFFGTLWDGIGKAFNVVFKAIGDAFKGYVNIWIGLINFIIGALDSVKIDIPKWVPVVGGQTFGINIPKIPQLADGGIVPATPGGRLVNVGEGGQAEAIIPLSRMNTGGNTASYNIVVNAGMGANGVQIAKELINTIKQYERANGAVWKSA